MESLFSPNLFLVREKAVEWDIPPYTPGNLMCTLTQHLIYILKGGFLTALRGYYSLT